MHFHTFCWNNIIYCMQLLVAAQWEMLSTSHYILIISEFFKITEKEKGIVSETLRSKDLNASGWKGRAVPCSPMYRCGLFLIFYYHVLKIHGKLSSGSKESVQDTAFHKWIHFSRHQWSWFDFIPVKALVPPLYQCLAGILVAMWENNADGWNWEMRKWKLPQPKD